MYSAQPAPYFAKVSRHKNNNRLDALERLDGMDAASRLALFQNAFQAREASGTRLGWAQESLFGSRPRLEQSIEINMVGLSKWQRTGPSAFATEASTRPFASRSLKPALPAAARAGGNRSASAPRMRASSPPVPWSTFKPRGQDFYDTVRSTAAAQQQQEVGGMKLTSSSKVVPDRAKPTHQPVPWSTFRPRGHDFYNVVQQQQQQQRKVVELQAATTSGKLHHHASGTKGAAGIDWTKLEVLLRAPLPSNTPQMMPHSSTSTTTRGLS